MLHVSHGRVNKENRLEMDRFRVTFDLEYFRLHTSMVKHNDYYNFIMCLCYSDAHNVMIRFQSRSRDCIKSARMTFNFRFDAASSLRSTVTETRNRLKKIAVFVWKWSWIVSPTTLQTSTCTYTMVIVRLRLIFSHAPVSCTISSDACISLRIFSRSFVYRQIAQPSTFAKTQRFFFSSCY